MSAETATTHAEIAGILKDYVSLDEYNATLDALNEAIQERDRLRGESEKTSGRVKDLESRVRGRAYRDAYDKVRKDLKIKDEFADDVFKLADLEQDADEPDEKAIRQALDGFVKDRKHYLDTEDKKRTLPAGEGGSRGKSTGPGDPDFWVSYKQLNDLAWMRENQGRMLEAKRAGTLVIDEDS